MCSYTLKSLRVLVVEHSIEDVAVIEQALRQSAGKALFLKRVDTGDDLGAALDQAAWDVVIVNYLLPHLNALEVLEIIRAKHPDLPVVIIPGKIGEAAVIEVMRAGARDYGLSSDPRRLVAVIEWELREAAVRRAREAAEAALRQREERFRLLIEPASDMTDYKQRLRELEAIAQVSTALRTASSQAEMAPVILTQLLQVLGAVGACLATRDPLTGETVIELGLGVWQPLTGARLCLHEAIDENLCAIGQVYVNDDVQHDSHFYRPAAVLLPDPCAVACVPLMIQAQTIGGLWVARWPAIAAAELRVLTSVADMAANALSRATLYEQTNQRLQRLTALRAIDTAILSSLDLQHTLDILLKQVTTQLNVDAADILLFDPETQTLSYVAGQGFRSAALRYTHLRLGEGQAGRAALLGRMVTVSQAHRVTDTFKQSPLLTGEDFLAYYGTPLVTKGRVVGVLEIFHRARLDPDSEWLSFLETLAGQAAIAIENATLLEGLLHSNAELALAYDTTLEGWSRALDLRDKETEGHTQRVTEMTVRLARAMGIKNSDLVHLRRGAMLHDIGKMAIPDAILLKPRSLTDEEGAIMRQHPVYAHQLLSGIDFLRSALDIPYCHHERWDGMGYPRGLKGDAIPLTARIFAVVDVWDALRSDRPYRRGWPEEQVRHYIQTQAGQHFDPDIVEAFFQLISAGR